VDNVGIRDGWEKSGQMMNFPPMYWDLTQKKAIANDCRKPGIEGALGKARGESMLGRDGE
jgi:hypothetical protein